MDASNPAARRPGVAAAQEDRTVLARFVLDGADCAILPCDAGTQCPGIGGFELDGRHYVIVRLTADPRAELLDLLTPRELEIALLVAAGDDCKAIARRLYISFHTVRVHLGRIYAKLGLHKQTELALLISARYGARHAAGLSRMAARAMVLVLPVAALS